LTVFVGRTAELRQLVAGLDRALQGRGGMFLLSGEPGIGKTRVAEELALEARKRDAAVYWGRSTLAEGAPPYWPWVQILRSVLRDVGDAEFRRLAGPGLAQILQVVPDLRGHFPDVTPTPGDDAQTRFGTYDSVVQLLLDASGARPMVLVLDDLHWADTPSLLLLQLLAGQLPHSRLIVIATYRDRELATDHLLRTHLADFVRRGETTELPIAGLRNPEVVSLLRVLTGFEPAADVAQRLQAQTGGNPFFLGELARTLGDAGPEPSQWKFPASPDVIPQGIGAVLRRRIETLSTDCRGALEIGAVAGHDIDLDLLETATARGRPRLLDLLDEAIVNGVVTRRGGRNSFAHGLVRDAVYSGISAARRGELHGLIGRMLEGGSFGSSAAPAVQLAHHFVEASAVDPSVRAKALEYASAAGRRALAELAYEEAVRLFELALGRAAPVDSVERAGLILDLGRARYLAGDIGGAMEAAEEVARMAEELDDRNLLARATVVARGVGGPGLTLRIKRLCNRAMRRPTQDASLRIQVLSQLTAALMQTGDAADERAAKESSREAVLLAQDAVDPDVIFAGIHARQMATAGPDGVDERLQLAERTLRLARETGRSSIAQWGHAWRLDALVQLGRIDEAELTVELLARLAGELHEPLARWRAVQAHSWLSLLRGSFAEADVLAEEARQLGRSGHHAPAEFTYLIHRIATAILVGGLEQAFQDMREQLRPLAEMEPIPPAFAAGPFALMGRMEEARAAVRQVAAAGLETIGPAMIRLPAMALLTEAITAVGEADLASAAYAALLPYAHLNVSGGANGFNGSVSRHLGMLSTTLKRWDEAAEHYEQAIEFELRMGARPFVVRSQIAYAEMLLRAGRDRDFRHARKLLETAIASSRELGMVPWQERATRMVKDLEGRGVTDHPLSRRELEVAGLVAQGLSNRAIAGRLHLSERTAESHVKNICDKLGFSSRSQVAAWVAGRRPPQ
jgi:DNA-binding CsgD family transcriptional regulator/tetratricopeptide (TPR) repeat protein